MKYRTGKKPEACIDARIALTHNSSNNLSGAINMLIENSCEKTPSTNKPLVIKGESNKSSVNFNIVDEVPIWPGCYGLQSEMRGCFQRNIQAHIARNFRYPKMAQERKYKVECLFNSQLILMEQFLKLELEALTHCLSRREEE